MNAALVAALVIAAASLSGALTLGHHPLMRNARRFMVPIAVGVFLSVVFFELLPEAFEATAYASQALAFGFLGFYVLAHLISQYHHHHGTECAGHHNRHEGVLILVGDAVHNFVDGIVIAISFMLEPAAGVAITAGILLHEVPQEIAEFSILLRAGYSKGRALFLNFLSATAVIIGVLVTTVFLEAFEHMVGILVAVAAGNLLYIAASDLLPELVPETHERKHFWTQFAFVAFGLVAMSALVLLSGETHAH